MGSPLKKRTLLTFLLMVFLAYLIGVATADRQNMIRLHLQKLRSQVMGYDSVLTGTFLMEAVSKVRPQNELFNTFSPPVDVVMIGDSLTANVMWNDVFPNVKIANRGIGGDRTVDILNRLDPILKLKPKKAFLQAGLNDFATGASVDQAFNTYTKIVQRLQKNGVTVYIQSTVECSRLRCGKEVEDVRKLNTLLRQYAKDKNITFIDLNQQLSSTLQGLLSQYTTDGSHLNAQGYVQWSKAITPYVSQ